MKKQQITEKKQKIQRNKTQRTSKTQLLSWVREHPYLQAQGIVGNHGVLRRLGSSEMGSDSEQRLMQKTNSSAVDPKTKGDFLDIKEKLGPGHSMDSRVKSRMGSAFRTDFDDVRVHTDANAAKLSNRFKARAFTVGQDIAFGAGEYRPGTLVGDSLIAHELAHVIQQKGAEIEQVGGLGFSEASLEMHADKAVLEAARNYFGFTKQSIFGFTNNLGTRVRTGLRLQRCVSKKLTDEEKYKEVKDKMSKAEKAFEVASKTLSNKEAAENAAKVADILGKANKAINTYDKGIVIYEGIKSLKDFSKYDPYTDPEGFAKAAGGFLATLGEVMKLSKIPGVSVYGQFLSDAGNFFVNMRKQLHPHERPRWQRLRKDIYTPKRTKV